MNRLWFWGTKEVVGQERNGCSMTGQHKEVLVVKRKFCFLTILSMSVPCLWYHNIILMLNIGGKWVKDTCDLQVHTMKGNFTELVQSSY